jgi:hypothetical protein
LLSENDGSATRGGSRQRVHHLTAHRLEAASISVGCFLVSCLQEERQKSIEIVQNVRGSNPL